MREQKDIRVFRAAINSVEVSWWKLRLATWFGKKIIIHEKYVGIQATISRWLGKDYLVKVIKITEGYER